MLTGITRWTLKIYVLLLLLLIIVSVSGVDLVYIVGSVAMPVICVALARRRNRVEGRDAEQLRITRPAVVFISAVGLLGALFLTRAPMMMAILLVCAALAGTFAELLSRRRPGAKSSRRSQ